MYRGYRPSNSSTFDREERGCCLRHSVVGMNRAVRFSLLKIKMESVEVIDYPFYKHASRLGGLTVLKEMKSLISRRL